MVSKNLNFDELLSNLNKKIDNGESTSQNSTTNTSDTLETFNEDINKDVTTDETETNFDNQILVPEFTLDEEYKIVDDSINLLQSIIDV